MRWCNNYICLFLLVSLIVKADKFPADYVNPFIGTSNGGHTHPGAVCPFGMVSVSPFNSYNPVDDPAYEEHKPYAYTYGSPFFSGFTHTNLSGVGCPDLGTFVVMATSGKLEVTPSDYACQYSEEVAQAGYYAVSLPEYGIKAEASATLRSGIERFTFSGGQGHILFNTGMSVSSVSGAYVKVVSPTEIEGYKKIGGFCGNGEEGLVYFVAKVSKKPQKIGLWNNKELCSRKIVEAKGNDVGAYFTYNLKKGEQVEIKVGVSYVGIHNARLNLTAEQSGFRFDTVRKAALSAWNMELSRVLLEGGTEKYKRMFYTALYHVLIHPNILNDVNGEYLAYLSGKIKNSGERDHYTIFSLWDTYRTVHPLLSLIYPERQSDMVNSLLDMYKESGRLPKWELAAMETNVMVGDPAIPVLVDTYMRGIRDFNVELAYQAMLKNADIKRSDIDIVRPGYKEFVKFGYIPEPDGKEKVDIPVWGSVSTGLEYCMADYALACMAKDLGKEADYSLYMKRAGFYQNYYDAVTGFMRPIHKNGKWLDNFDPKPHVPVWHSRPGFVEGCSWHYSFFVPFDMCGLVQLNGGGISFVNKLIDCFERGYFNMGNEPDISYPYLFNYVKGEEHRTQYWTRHCINTYFGDNQNGITDNDDCGTMSAWLVFTMMGLYPDCPANPVYQLTSPVFDKVTIQLNNKYYSGNSFVIQRGQDTDNKMYIESIYLNGEKISGYSLKHSTLSKGGILSFILKE
jgi:predicted alpha-1,2-mannosidase